MGKTAALKTETDWRGQHGVYDEHLAPDTEEEQARPGVRVRRIQPPIERYLMRRQITPEQYDAAVRLRQDYEFGLVGVNDSGKAGAGGGLPGHSAAQLDAATAYRRAVEAIGLRISAVVLPIVLGYNHGGEIAVETLAKRARQSRHHVMGVFCVGLDMLADHYGR